MRVGTGALLLLILSGCSRPKPIQNTLHLSVDSSTSVPTAMLSLAPNEIAIDTTGTIVLDSDFVSRAPELGDIADVDELPGGKVVVLNRRDRIVVGLDSAGAVTDTLARPGEGPGEISVPWALAAVGARLVVLQQFPLGNILTAIPLDSGAAIARTAPVPADWLMMTQRGPNLLLGFPTQTGIEDWTQRLVVINDSNFVVAMRDDSLALDTAKVRLLRFRPDLTLRDTIGVSPAPPVVAWRGQSDGPPPLGDALFTARPWFVAGTGWTAAGRGDSTGGTVTFADGRQLRVDWPQRPRPINDDDRMAAAHWTAVYTTRAYTEARNQFRAMTARQRADAERLFLAVIPFAPEVPQLSAAFGAGHCLWLAGFAPKQFLDGTALTLVGINVVERKLVGPVRIAENDLRIRLVTSKAIYVKRFNEDDEAELVRYRLPDETEC